MTQKMMMCNVDIARLMVTEHRLKLGMIMNAIYSFIMTINTWTHH